MPSDALDSPNPAATVSCRPPALNWVFVALCAPTGVMMWFGAHNPTKAGPPSASEAAFVQTCAVALLVTAAALAVWQMRARIVADADGLRWRHFGGWKSARWEEVRDFYDRLPSQAPGQRSLFWAVIKTAAGSVRFSNDWTDAGALQEQVERRAVNAAVRQWDLLGSRPCDSWPRVFRYDTWQNIWTPRVLLKLALTALGYLLTPPLQQAMSQAGQVGWGVTLAGLGVYVLLIASLGAFFLMPLAQYRAAARRKAERIMVDTNGIVFEDGAQRVAAAWADVTGYGIAPGSGILAVRYVVETRQGDFDFLAVLSGATLLQAIIRRYAEEAADKEWRPRVNPEALGGEASRWSGGQVGVGARVPLPDADVPGAALAAARLVPDVRLSVLGHRSGPGGGNTDDGTGLRGSGMWPVVPRRMVCLPHLSRGDGRGRSDADHAVGPATDRVGAGGRLPADRRIQPWCRGRARGTAALQPGDHRLRGTERRDRPARDGVRRQGMGGTHLLASSQVTSQGSSRSGKTQSESFCLRLLTFPFREGRDSSRGGFFQPYHAWTRWPPTR